jgi:hypothetical protein
MGTNEAMLQKVRALLAKAEATPFEAEADAFTAKAQELIVRYRIDRVLLDKERAREGGSAISRRVDLEDPYLKAKVVLLSNIADANQCRVIWPTAQRYVHVFGVADDIDAVEELFTSLLLQATGALRRAGSKQDEFGRSRTAGFRRAFLLSFALRIGQRLAETADATVEAAAAETGVELVPLFAARAEASKALALETFPNVRPLRASVSDTEGWHAGAAFADQADLSQSGKLARGA